MKTDRELLELAAKAVGYAVCEPFRHGEFRVRGPDGLSFAWNPRDDDGDALRLAVKRKILRCHMDLFHKFYEEEIANGLKEDAATRRAIVRAAAAIGEQA